MSREATIRHLRPGLDAPQVADALAKAGFESTPALETWFAWHNGTDGDTIGVSQIVPGFYPLSVDEAVSTAETFGSLPTWKSRWLPVFADGGGYFYVVDQSAAPDGPIRLFAYDQAEHQVEYLNLATFVATIAEAYDRGAFTSHPLGYLDVDDAVYERIAAEKNPGVEWWA